MAHSKSKLVLYEKIIGNKKTEEFDKLGKTMDINLDIKYFTEKEFKELIKNKDSLCNEVIKDHILIFNCEKFIKLIWENYYDFN